MGAWGAGRLHAFERLREEIDNRTRLGNALLVGEVTALGAGISVVSSANFIEALLGMALVTSYLWLLWLDHTQQVFKIAAYVALQLAPRLRSVNRGALGWEGFLRRLDQGGKEAAKVLYPMKRAHESGPDVTIGPTRSIVGHVSWVFGALPLVLLIIYGYLRYDYLYRGGMGAWGRVAGFVLALGLWGISLGQWRQFTRSVNAIEDAVLYESRTTQRSAVRAPAEG